MSVNKLRLQRNLREWYLANARDLPWRHTTDPYAILVSEYMLQQTQVTTVIPYYTRWMQRFPTVQALAAADEQEILSFWQGLGYYARARNLHRTSRAVVEEHSGSFPKSIDALRALPGIGDYTAAAVAAFACDEAVPVIDANIARVLARIFNYTGRIDQGEGKTFLKQSAISLLPAKGGRLHNSALMELGALVCTSRKPQCPDCPISRHCQAVNPESLPVKKPRALTVVATQRHAWIFKEGKIWLRQSSESRWKGLWLLPEIKAIKKLPPLYEGTFSIMHYRMNLLVFEDKCKELSDLRGFSPSGIESLPMPSPHRRAVAALLKSVHSSADVR